MQLSRPREEKLKALALRAQNELETAQSSAARKHFLEAFEMLPEPRDGWDIAPLLLLGAAEAELALHAPKRALNLCGRARACAAVDPVSATLIEGQAYFDLDEQNRAGEKFLYVLLNAGAIAFESSDPKYLAFAAATLRPPAGLASWHEYEPELPDEDSAEESTAPALHQAIGNGDGQAVRALIARGADVNAVWDQGTLKSTPLHEAAYRGDLQVARDLLEAGANPNPVPSGFTSPLHTACAADAAPIVGALLEADANLEAKDGDDRTPLMVAVEMGSAKVVPILLEAGASVAVKNKRGKTPFEVAQKLSAADESFKSIAKALAKQC